MAACGSTDSRTETKGSPRCGGKPVCGTSVRVAVFAQTASPRRCPCGAGSYLRLCCRPFRFPPSDRDVVGLRHSGGCGSRCGVPPCRHGCAERGGWFLLRLPIRPSGGSVLRSNFNRANCAVPMGNQARLIFSPWTERVQRETWIRSRHVRCHQRAILGTTL